MGGGDPDVVLHSVTQQVMAEMATSSREQSCTMEQFTQMRPSLFFGGPDPLVAENCVQDIEDMLIVLSCTDEQKVLFATFKLTEEAKRWWRSARLLEEQRLEPIAVTWSCFREISFERYFPAIVRSAKVVEFLHLTQGSITVSQYAARFIKLSRFAPYLVPDEERKVRKFEEGLRQSLFEQVVGPKLLQR
ncbi:uncharacterized protein LOC131148506 [Malania oleifera]|uniref:uncharacterized protein LOC131148506 n=1 Tax=Malania oleifera TaxID=397392 RepID=UPI0025ADC9C9|nr:uncharacterized protein LOC131148506 [Malania oleifera]